MEFETLLPIDASLRGATASLVLVSIITLLRDAGAHWPARLGGLFGLGVIAYLACSAPWFTSLPQPVFEIVLFFCFVNPVLFWLLGRALFDDGFKPSLTDGLIVLFVAALGFAKHIWGEAWPAATNNALVILFQMISVGLVAHLLLIVLKGRNDDLVEARRKFRLTFVLAIGFYVLVIATAELSLVGSQPSDALKTLNTLGLLIVSLFITTYILRLRSDDLVGNLLLPAPAAVSGHNIRQAVDDPGREGALIKALQKIMDEGQIYKTEGLTIGQLADHLKTPEYRLRRAINQQMGFRNFTSFLNHYRLAEAKAALADPALARTPVLTIALDLGYASIGPFNRAFKAETGTTPSAFRATHMGA